MEEKDIKLQRTVFEQGLGLFGSAEDAALLDEAVQMAYEERRSGAQLIAAMQASPHKDIEIEPLRGPASVRDVLL